MRGGSNFLGAESNGRASWMRAGCRISCRRPRKFAKADWTARTDSARSAGSTRRDYRANRSEDDYQCPQFRGKSVHGGLRRCERADLVEHGGRPVELSDAVRRTIEFKSPEGKEYRVTENRLSCSFARAAGICWRNMSWSTENPFRADCSIFCLYLFHNAQGTHPAGFRTLFLSPENGESSGSAIMERCVHHGPGRNWSSAGYDSSHRSDRNDSCRF